MRVSHNPLVKLLVKLRMAWADARGHHGKVWDYEPGEYYLGMKKGRKDHEKRHGIKLTRTMWAVIIVYTSIFLYGCFTLL